MAIRKVVKSVFQAKKAPVRKGTSKKASIPSSSAKAKPTIAKACRVKGAPSKKKDMKKLPGKKPPLNRNTTTKAVLGVAAANNKSHEFDVERMTERVELADIEGATVPVEALKIGLLLAAVDGNCDKNEIKKFKTVAKACGGLSDAKIAQIISQTQRRISAIEETVRHGATEEDVVNKFMTEASNIGIHADCRNFVFWMSIAMVDGEFSSVERKVITALQQHANKLKSLMFFRSTKRHDISDSFLKRCEMILSGIYKAETAGDKRLVQNRLKSLQTLIEIIEA